MNNVNQVLTMFIKWNIVFHEWFKICSIFRHVCYDIKSVLEMIAPMSLHLVPQSTKQTVSEIYRTDKQRCHTTSYLCGTENISKIMINHLHIMTKCTFNVYSYFCQLILFFWKKISFAVQKFSHFICMCTEFTVIQKSAGTS